MQRLIAGAAPKARLQQPTHPARRAVRRLVSSSAFEWACLALILANTAVLAMAHAGMSEVSSGPPHSTATWMVLQGGAHGVW